MGARQKANTEQRKEQTYCQTAKAGKLHGIAPFKLCASEIVGTNENVLSSVRWPISHLVFLARIGDAGSFDQTQKLMFWHATPFNAPTCSS